MADFGRRKTRRIYSDDEVYGSAAPKSGGTVTANALRTTSGPTDLAIGAIADGQNLKRVGSTVVGADAGGGGASPVYAHTSLAVTVDGGLGNYNAQIEHAARYLDYDNGGFTTGARPDRFTAPAPGLYAVYSDMTVLFTNGSGTPADPGPVLVDMVIKSNGADGDNTFRRIVSVPLRPVLNTYESMFAHQAWLRLRAGEQAWDYLYVISTNNVDVRLTPFTLQIAYLGPYPENPA